MRHNNHTTGPVCAFFIGINDNRMARVNGYNARGEVFYGHDGNTDFMGYTHTPTQNKFLIYTLWFENPSWNMPSPDIFINAAADADIMSQSLIQITEVLDKAKKALPNTPVFNDPRKIGDTRRDIIYQKYAQIEGVEIPKTLRFKPESRDAVMETAAREGFTFPFIVRLCGQHQGKQMVKVDSPQHVAVLDALPFDGSDFYLIQFKDYKDTDGLYKKLRLIMMGGQMYVRHFISSDNWKIHAGSRGGVMTQSAAAREQEKDVMANITKKVSPVSLQALEKIYQQSGLDYLGFDCAIKPDGTLLCFEINAAMNAMAPSDYAAFPYLQPYGDALIAGYNNLLAAKINASRERLRA